MRRFILGLVIVPLLLGGAWAQQPTQTPTPVPATQPPAPPPPPSSSEPDLQLPEIVFRAEANYVEVDASVTDERGDFVRDLTRDDFEIFEEGVRQEVATFAEIVIPIEQFETTLVQGRPLPRDIETNVSGLGGRIYAIVLDEVHTQAERSGVVRDIARQFIEQHMAANDVATVVHAGGEPHAAQAFTSDKQRLLESVDRFTGRKAPSATLERLSLIDHQKDMLFVPDPVEMELAPRPGQERDPWDLERALRARAAMQTLENVARDLGEVRGRRKAILFFSEGIDYDTLDVMRTAQSDASSVLDSMKDAIAIATQNNVALYAIDPRGLVGGLGPEDIQMTAPARGAAYGIDSQSFDEELRRSRDSLRTLAEKTGGTAALNTNEFATAYTRIVRANSQYYLLGYYPKDFRRDGEFRRIEVRLGRPGITVVARDGYVRPRGREEKEETPETAAMKGTSPEVRELLESAWPQPGLALGVTAATFKGSEEDASVAVTIQLPGQGLPFRQEGDRAVNEIEVSLIAIDQDGKVRGGDRILVRPALLEETHELVQRAGLRLVQRLQLPPGRYQLRVAAREAEQGQRGSVFYDLQVPDFGDETLTMSGVLLASRGAEPALTPSIDDMVKQRLETPPTVARTFEPEDVLTAYAEVYDALELTHDVAVTTRVVGVNGGEVFRVTGQRGSSDEFGYRVEIPLAGVGPGQYLLQIEAMSTVGEAVASRELSFEVAEPELVAELEPDDVPTPPPAALEPRWSTPRLTSRIDRLEAWLTAVDQHEPGTDDGPARMVRFWSPTALRELTRDLGLVVRLINDPSYPVLWQVDPRRPGRPQRSDYSPDDDRRLRAMAHAAVDRCTPEGDAIPHADAVARCAQNRLLKRGAILHTDAAMFVMLEATRPRAGGDPRPDRWRVSFGDGQQRGAQGAPGHWVLAEALLEFVAPGPEEDETVRLWYIATSAWGQYYERHTRHEDRAARLFPKDADVLFLAGTLHETLASPTIQSLVRSISVPGNPLHQIGAEREELEKAERLFRRALEADPALTEARIRRGRALHRLGRHEQAARELQQATSALSSGGTTADDDDGLLLYYAEMFLGAASEALGQHDRARNSYARAAELYPGAPSPRFALSQLALQGNDRAAALDAARLALRPPTRRQDRDDPWWRYHYVQGRGVATRFATLYQSLTGEP